MMLSVRQKIEIVNITLRTISKLEAYDRLTFRSKVVDIQRYGWLTSLQRSFFGDSREDTVAGLNTILDDIESICNEFKKSSTDIDQRERQILLYRLKKSLSQCISTEKKGFAALKISYCSDPSICSHLESLVERGYLLIVQLDSLIGDIKKSPSIDCIAETLNDIAN